MLPEGKGHNAAQILAQPPKALMVYQAGSQDTAAPAAFDHARSTAQFYVYAGAYACSGVRRSAHAVLPIGLPPEVDGSLVNADGRIQRHAAGAKLPGDARPGWRVLRALGAALGLPGFEFTEFGELAERVAALAAATDAGASTGGLASRLPQPEGLVRVATVPIYRSDAVVRRAKALQETPLALPAHVALHPDTAHARGLAHGSTVKVSDGSNDAELLLAIDDRVPREAAWVPAGHAEVAKLRGTGALISVTRA